MSLVGTRPPTVDEWDKYELHHRARLATKPGLTGMWQVSGRSNITDLLSVVIGYLNPGVSMWSNLYGRNYLLFMLGGIISSIWLGFVCKWFVIRNIFLQFLGQNTITILAVHEPIKRIVLKIAEIILIGKKRGCLYVGEEKINWLFYRRRWT